MVEERKPGKKIPPDVWNEPVDPERLNGRIHRTFMSKTLGEEIGYLVYLPPSYEHGKEKGFPVIYWLHGVQGGLLKGSIFFRRYLEAMNDGEAPEVILVFPKGRHYSSYCDSADGNKPVETVIIKELIPHIDKTYRTVARRAGRAIEGSSMGGFGAFHLAFKYPDLFCAATSLIGALNDAENIGDRSSEGLDRTFGGDIERFKKESPTFLVKKNADKIRGKMAIRLFDGDQDFFYQQNEKFHKLLNDLEIPHTYTILLRVGHDQGTIYREIGMRMFGFYWKVFSEVDSKKEQENSEIDWIRARQLVIKEKAGESLSNEESAFLERMRSGGKSRTGLVPLTDLAEGTYKYEDGGLYGGGSNIPPESHRSAAIEQLSKIEPLDALGEPSSDGSVVLVSIGMSNTTQEFSVFKSLANKDSKKSPRFKLVDAAQGGQDSLCWADPENRTHKNKPSPWDVLEKRLKEAEVSSRQVQAAWIKLTRAQPALLGEFPTHALTLRDDLLKVVNELRRRFPNMRIVYLSSRIYAGYALKPLSPEPYSYENAFSVRWLIRDQIEGAPELNYDSRRGEVKAPLLLWGPYLWGDGTTPRKNDGLVWERKDLIERDGIHPSESGCEKVAQMLLKFFKTDPLAKPLYSGSAEFITESMGTSQIELTPTEKEGKETTIQRVDTHGLSLSGTDEWVDKNTQEPPGTKYKTFHSKTVNEKVFYLIYLPPSYETEAAKRYPVVYWLHGRGRSPRVGFYFVERLMGAIENGTAPEMIVILVNGRSNSMYCNSFDGKIPVESVIVKDLVPHIDQTYRTVSSRQGRAVEGSSMGGFGALHLGFKYPELFGVVTSISGAISPPEGFRTMEKERATPQRKEEKSKTKKKSRPNLFETTFGGNMDYARANNPWTLISQNAEIIRKRTALRMIVGKEDRLLNVNRQFHTHLTDLKIPHEYVEVEKGRHSYYEVIDKLSDKEIFDFYARVFSSNR